MDVGEMRASGEIKIIKQRSVILSPSHAMQGLRSLKCKKLEDGFERVAGQLYPVFTKEKSYKHNMLTTDGETRINNLKFYFCDFPFCMVAHLFVFKRKIKIVN